MDGSALAPRTQASFKLPTPFKRGESAVAALGGPAEVGRLINSAQLNHKAVTPLLHLRRSHDYARPVMGEFKEGRKQILFQKYIDTDGKEVYVAKSVVHHVAEFESPADFQYLPRKFVSGMDGGYVQAVLSRPTVPPVALPPGEEVPVVAMPRSFVVPKMATKSYDFRPGYKLVHPSKQKELKFNFSDAGPVPVDPVVDKCSVKEPELARLVGLLRNLFNARPVWSFLVITQTLKANAWFQKVTEKDLRIVLRQVAYYVQQGPFRTCWFRLGYDPRQNVSSWVYQVVDSRAKFGKQGEGDVAPAARKSLQQIVDLCKANAGFTASILADCDAPLPVKPKAKAEPGGTLPLPPEAMLTADAMPDPLLGMEASPVPDPAAGAGAGVMEPGQGGDGVAEVLPFVASGVDDREFLHRVVAEVAAVRTAVRGVETLPQFSAKNGWLSDAKTQQLRRASPGETGPAEARATG